MDNVVPSLSMEFDQHERDNFSKIEEAASGEESGTHSQLDFQSSSAFDDGWEGAASFRDMKYESEEMKNLLKLERSPDQEKVIKSDYTAQHLFPQWILENKDWKSTQCKSIDNKISDILQIPYAVRTLEQTSILIHWLMSVWPTAYMLGYKRCGQMFKVFHFQTCKPGDDVIVENERGLTFYIVISGSATVHKDGIGIVANISMGQSFGELALTEGNDVRSATVRAHTQLELLRLHKVDYDRFVKDIQLTERRENLMVLRDCKIFDNWPRSKIQKMCTTCSRRTFKPGDVIFRQGDVPDSIYFIVDGKISIHKELMIIVRNRWPVGKNEWGGVAKKRLQLYPVGMLQRGNFFGELSIIKNKTRTATAKAVTRCVLLCLDKLEFVHLLRSGRAMETVSAYSSRYTEDQDILSKAAILNGGPSTTAVLNEYIKTQDEPDEEVRKSKEKLQRNDPVHSLLVTRPKTANARIRNTVVTKIAEKDDENTPTHHEENIKFATPNRRNIKSSSASVRVSSGHNSHAPGLRFKVSSNTDKINSKAKKHRGKLTSASDTMMVASARQQQDEEDEERLKLKLKNENKASSVLSDRMKAKLEPLKKHTEKQINEAQLRGMTQGIVVANRKLAYLDETTGVKRNSHRAKRETLTKTDHGATTKGKKLGFAADRRHSIVEGHRHSASAVGRRQSIIAAGAAPSSPTKNKRQSHETPSPTRPGPLSQAVGQVQTQTPRQEYTFGAVSKSPQGNAKKLNPAPQIDFKDKHVIPMMGVIKSVILESTTGRSVKSNCADDIAQFVESAASGDRKAMPVGKRLTRQNTRDLTELQTQEVTANTPVSHSNPDLVAKQAQVRQVEASNDMKQQEVRQKIFKMQGSLRSLL